VITLQVDDLQTTWRVGFIGIFREAMTNTRPEHERWSVQIAAPMDGITRLHFSRDAKPSQSMALTLADDLSSYRVFYWTACRFLRRGWLGAIQQHALQPRENVWQ
jgi:hypothetical protein